ncbi:glycosyltransferase family A protein [Bariatricus sp. HCP28S3_D3]|uniref:glycosyltransferase family A protein n=1 Tax=Bariatricus sp. HCP28S3_D3 TaxID=3438901 RepID=UPI003F8C0562
MNSTNCTSAYKYNITVFTPTYNRAYIIEQLYRSLQRQTYCDFEWLIVDDGSTDDTSSLIEKWQLENNAFPIRYYKKENGGKCRAINYGVDRAQGRLFFNVDSDDYLTDDALEKVARWEETLPKDRKFCGVVGNLGTSETETPNAPWPKEYRDASLLERYPQYCNHPIDGERAWVFYTDIQKEYKYPEFAGENFITPAVTWNRMAHDGYLVRIYDDIIWVYEYQPDGLTASGNKRFIKRPQGHGLWLREMAEFMNYSWVEKFKMYYSFYCDHNHHLSDELISEYIGAPLWEIKIAKILRKCKIIVKRKR